MDPSEGRDTLDDEEAPPSSDPNREPRPVRYAPNIALFLLTVVTVFLAGAAREHHVPTRMAPLQILAVLPYGWRFAVPLLAILLAHEFGHYFTARFHKVDASLPYFIPIPSIIGTWGAVIWMPDRIRSRNALFDIGASGPLAGFVIALPVLIVGIATSKVEVPTGSYFEEGQSILYIALKRLILGPIPDGSDMSMSSMAFAGWVGMLVTMLNLLPVGQLDGGHIAYALFGKKQNRYARWIHISLLGAFALNIVRFIVPVLRHHDFGELWQAAGNSAFWLVWFALLTGMRSLSGINHPPTDPSTLSPARRVLAVACLVIFVILFMPTPFFEISG